MRIGITNLKGGVGKTTLTQNLAVCFAHMGYKTCIVDTDKNQNSVSWSGARDESLPEILVVGVTDPKAVNKTVDKLHKDNEIVLIDGTPSLSEMTTRIILASDILLIPILPSAHDVRSMGQFFERYEQALEFRDSIPAYFFVNQFSEKYIIHRSIRDMLKQFEIGIMKSTFKDRVSYLETAVEGMGVYEYSDKKAKAEAVKMTQEVLKLAKKEGLIE
ncbi:MAG: chromosome partitioning protein [Moraxellaceae bacterium]|nr:MAG: chromosome partitioning protein [Moraxellaceae bacterium]